MIQTQVKESKESKKENENNKQTNKQNCAKTFSVKRKQSTKEKWISN